MVLKIMHLDFSIKIKIALHLLNCKNILTSVNNMRKITKTKKEVAGLSNAENRTTYNKGKKQQK